MTDTSHDTTPRTTPASVTPEERRPPRLAEVPAFRDLMARGWITPDRTPTTVPGAVEAAAAHRARLSAAMPGATLVVVSGSAPTRNDDCRYAFRADSDFVWLTGVQIEGAVLVMHAVPGGHDAVLHVPAPAHPGDPRFFSDADHGELWVGPAPAHADWQRVLGIPVRDPSRVAPDLSGVRDVRRAGAVTGVPSALADVPRDPAVVATLGELRVIKDAWEIEELRRAVDDTVEGFAEVVREIPRARAQGGERWLQGTFDRHARTVGTGPGYATIVGGGGHATTLHWVRCDGPIRDGELVLLDMGVEARSLYTADVTRTIPVDGTFTPEQRLVHDIVERSHRAGLEAVAPGRPLVDFHHASMEVIAQGLHDMGLLPVSVDEALSPAGQHHRRWLVCGIGHHLGLDVHDCSGAGLAGYDRAVEAGMVLTVEPGLYFPPDDGMVPPELRGIGVRIEDDIVVTQTGSDVISDALPIDARGLESWMRAQRSPS
ncbi:aminopeptidase P family protein [Clavibacter michiganensis]|uniref:Xaa-Pro aminopeptidase n=3 Tax=Clavibacter michiganensis subsp. insidiosus TaxID=33014 RepID=A0A0D5CKH7_9MICO|nr:aminopeptidase P family protein [Clavibacter michiganensis]AJW79809.1 Xaa-Pro aminopeptidase [Clavibacter michiganensis subsp. insidiosus]AWF99204.1 Xaa-Pro aminopeptidase [Clavibacter michiganensis subsp. insidiosus]AWG02236.1 Xaa-Pro aminopeptidase [Clavibacter michiganensis subsp. insidiosus]OQJ59298.1 peptidase M24 family protein [Clavibacter michiganensis subsp. insidiosus]RII87602.1 peptidase M24 family protein [Clavibacter michiganensis subsp. insidiosus]